MRASNPLWFRLFTTVFMFASLTVSAHDHPEDSGWGPALGTQLPSITVKNQEGEKLDIADLATRNGVAIAFVRSADWCPFCKRQIIDLNKNREEFAKRGITLVALSYDNADILGKFSKKHDIGYTLISDKKSKVINALGIRNEEHEKGSSGYGIPHPGIMVFDAKGVLVAKFAEEGYRKRPPVEGVLGAIDRHQAM